MIDEADATLTALDAQIAETQARLNGIHGIALRVGGELKSFDRLEIKRLGAAVALQVLVSGQTGELDGILPGQDTHQLIQAINLAVRAATRDPVVNRARNDTRRASDISIVIASLIEQNFADLIDDADSANRNALRDELNTLRALRASTEQSIIDARARLATVLPASIADESADVPGWYLLRMAGSGWVIKSNTFAWYAHGDQVFAAHVENVERPRWTGTHWSLPIGTGLSALFAEWKQEKREETAKMCKVGTWHNPAQRPVIWQGVAYAVVSGPFDSLKDLTNAEGLYPGPGTQTDGSDSWLNWTWERTDAAAAWAFCAPYR